MSVFEAPVELAGHEQVVFCHDPSTGLKAIIAIYSSALGPALGGTRFYPYASEAGALNDVLDLSKGMAYKNALAGLDHGGGKAVIWGDPSKDKNEAMLRAYGRFVESLGGRYITACDVGTYVQDMDHIARETRFCTGRSPDHGGAGDSSVLTAFGVFQAMRASAQHRWGSADLAGKTVGVAGVGKVGRHLVGHLTEAGARVIATDVNSVAQKWLTENYPLAKFVGSTEELLEHQLHVYAPCAMGGALSDESVSTMNVEIVCGAANNQLARPGIDKLLADRGILYAPDYLANSGGVVQVADEFAGPFNFERAKRRTENIFTTTLEILARSAADGIPPGQAADQLAEERISAVGKLQALRLF
ncbi:Glu/Leu/Phe/Val dehydrogenase dimerization domain-containing protein [Natronoglycomyces albus]|uniref:Glu/Leu/Phe/Val dehydrogenase n=1 Tax=Natronoglycomyces albus TaxID=2811108 RepID=A0A895XNA6_9ACTN|nr:Glu/Leu/Phe/Val dehydrogenase dimerization domain-containing protein [Natronoglycomyces albus]QSB05262.1 Glu/Leu/Phe/Val dehydrogenase [Natronoglycomyces albus]